MAFFKNTKPVLSPVQIRFAATDRISEVPIERGMSHTLPCGNAVATADVLDRNTRAFLAFTAFCGVFAIALIGCTSNQKFYLAVLGYTLPTLSFVLSNMVPAVISIYFRPERGGIVSLGLKANLVGTIICLSKAMLVILFKEKTIKRTGPPRHLALQGTTVSFGVRPRTSMQRFALTMFLLTISIGVASSADVAAVNNTEAISFVDVGVPVGDKLPPDCYYVSKCVEDCMSCYPRRPRGPDFKCCS